MRLLVFIVTLLVSSCGHSQGNSSDDQAQVMIRNFYASYIPEISKISPNEAKLDQIRGRYCTKNILKKIKEQELDYDPFLNAQDSDIGWLKTLEVSVDSGKPNAFIVSYMDSDRRITVIKLMVVKVNDGHRIDSIL